MVRGIKQLLLRLVFSPSIKLFLKKADKVVKTVCPCMYKRVLFPVKLSIKRYRIIQRVAADNEDYSDGGKAGKLNRSNWIGEKRISFVMEPLVSIIVPNCNDVHFLRERLESIYNQTYKNIEVILLDNCLIDGRRDILVQYANRYPQKTVTEFHCPNEEVELKQWNAGIAHARGQFIWIAESNDWCALDFLEKMIPQFELQSVMLAFCRSIFIRDGKQVWTLEKYFSDISGLDFSKPFIMSAHNVVQAAFGMKNIIPSISSVVFRNTGKIPQEIFDWGGNSPLFGDWLFYLHTICGGCISYTNQTTNYYRVRENGAPLLNKSVLYYREQELISRYIARHFDVELQIFKCVLKNLEEYHRKTWKDNNLEVVHDNYSINRIGVELKNRIPNVLMCCYSIQIGGGETYPIVLANEMKRQGVVVTFLNFDLSDYSQEIRDMLRPDIPVINLERVEFIGAVLCHTGAEIVHSHHAVVDHMLSICLQRLSGKCKQIITMHGMYESMEREDCVFILNDVIRTCKQFIYIADKNLTVLKELKFIKKMNLVKIANGLPKMEVTPVKRKDLGIGEDDFVLCIVSRALPEKGWQEAANAVIKANKSSQREIHLILVGEGEMRNKLETLENPFIHVVGPKSNVRDYYATSDMGLLPSYFKGESYPLSIIECMLSGKPVIATNVGEIKNQLTDSGGALAGILLELNDWKLNEDELKDAILKVSAKDSELYVELISHVKYSSQKFDITEIVKQHIGIYQRYSKESSCTTVYTSD